MQNPVTLTRDIIDKQVGTADEKDTATQTEAERELERIRALHEGWLQHPITLIVLNKLQERHNNKLVAAFQNALIAPQSPNPQMAEAATLNYALNYCKTLTGL